MLDLHLDSFVLTATINRPEVRNAFNDELIQILTDLFTNIPDNVRVIVLKGEGPMFCSGADLNYMRETANLGLNENYQEALKLANLFKLINNCPFPVIVKAHGAVFGGGCGLVAAADITIAAKSTKFAFSEVRLGLVPATISTFVLPKIGQSYARALFLTGEVFDAEYALRIGLVHDVVEESLIETIIDEKIKAILRGGPKAITRAKQIALDLPLPMERSAYILAQVKTSGEAKEGMQAFLDKRPAQYVINHDKKDIDSK